MTYPNDDGALRNGRKITENYELTPRHQQEIDEDINPDSDASLLRGHFASSNESHDSLPRTTTSVGPLQRLISFMSRTPLFLRSSPAQGTGSYGALPIHSLNLSTDGSEIDEEDTDDIRRRDRRKGKGNTLRQVKTNGSSRSGRVDPSSNGSTATRKTRRRQSEPGVDPALPVVHTVPIDIGGKLFENIIPGTNGTDSVSRKSGEDVETHTDSEDDTWSVEDPPDNSPLVNCPSHLLQPDEDTNFDIYILSSMSPRVQILFSVKSVKVILSNRSQHRGKSRDLQSFYVWISKLIMSTNLYSYPQVRASVSATDNTALSISTPRMWTLSLLFALLGSATNLFFSLRYPSVAITPVIALVLVHPLGRLWDRLLKRGDDPAETFEDGTLAQRLSTSSADDKLNSQTRQFRLWLAQGNWNEKEHACVYISSNVSFGFAFATDVIVEQAKFYHQETSLLYQILLTISTQILGYAFAGLTRRYLVRPPSMIWPGTLMSTAMFTTMHKSENKTANGWKVSRWKFFLYVWLGAFAWYFLPGLLMPALSYFSVITWFAPKNVIVANLFGVASGLGLFPMTFDWAQIAYIGSPLLTPWWAAANVVGGLVIVMWIVAPILYYKNALYSAFMPILSSAVFDDTGNPYDVSKILTPDFLFDKEAYDNYSRVYLPITYVLAYAVQFAGLAALVTHTACWHGRDIWKQSKKSWKEDRDSAMTEYAPVASAVGASSSVDTARNTRSRIRHDSRTSIDDSMAGEDVHSRLMRKYEDVPMAWYLLTFIAMLAIGTFVVEYYPVYLPWYGLLLALAITTVLYIPVGIVMAITNQQSSLYLICQLICGVVFPGRPVANMVFVTYCYISSAQGIKFSSDLKLGHYMKIPPRLLFSVQMVATLVASFTQIGVLNWMFAYIPNICTPQAINGFTCPIARVHFNGSILWGVVGPQRFFGPGALYRSLIWAFPVGAIAPIGVWLLGRRNKKNLWRKVNLPVLLGSLSWIPPATGLNFSVWAMVCFIFNYVVRRRASAWWGKYTMTMSAALDSGLAFALVVVFFGFIYPGWMDGFRWWGTEVYKQGCDWQACPYKRVAPGEHFGPS